MTPHADLVRVNQHLSFLRNQHTVVPIQRA